MLKKLNAILKCHMAGAHVLLHEIFAFRYILALCLCDAWFN